MYLIKYQPFTNPKMNKLEIFNELTILVCNYTLIAFSDISTSGPVKYDFGWFMLAVVIGNVVINVSFIVREAWRGSIRPMLERKKILKPKVPKVRKEAIESLKNLPPANWWK